MGISLAEGTSIIQLPLLPWYSYVRMGAVIETFDYVRRRMHDPDLGTLVTALLESPQMQALWHVKDRGMPVFAHTVDVALLCLERLPQARETSPSLNIKVVTVGSLLHDLSKASARESRVQSHSQIMSCYPELAAAEAQQVLREAMDRAGQDLSAVEVEGVLHVVVSHHGPWGKIPPRTEEAKLVHACDLYSAINHRLAPVDANDILPHLDQGRKWSVIAALLGVGTAVLRQRIKDACQAELVDDWNELLRIWRRRGSVLVGSEERVQQLEGVRFALRCAHEVPDSILQAIGSL